MVLKSALNSKRIIEFAFYKMLIHIHLLCKWFSFSVLPAKMWSGHGLTSRYGSYAYVQYSEAFLVFQLTNIINLTSPSCRIMQIVCGGKVSRLDDLLVIRGKTFAIVRRFETPNKTEKFAEKPSRLEANLQKP